MKFLNGGVGGGGAGNEIIDRNFNRHIQRLIKKHNTSQKICIKFCRIQILNSQKIS